MSKFDETGSAILKPICWPKFVHYIVDLSLQIVKFYIFKTTTKLKEEKM